MKYLLAIFLLLINFTWAEEEEPKNYTASVLEGFQNFKVIPFITPFEKIDQQSIFKMLENSFKKHGKVLVTEKASIFDYIRNLNHQKDDNIFFIEIDKKGGQIIGSIKIYAEVEIQKNKQKTACPIWKKKDSIWIRENQEDQTEQTIINLIDEMIDGFADHFKKANPKSKQAVFHIQKCQDM